MSLIGEQVAPGFSLLSFSIPHFFLIIIITLTSYYFWFQSTRYFKLGNKIPGFPPLPFIGNALVVVNKTPTGKT